MDKPFDLSDITEDGAVVVEGDYTDGWNAGYLDGYEDGVNDTRDENEDAVASLRHELRKADMDSKLRYVGERLFYSCNRKKHTIGRLLLCIASGDGQYGALREAESFIEKELNDGKIYRYRPTTIHTPTPDRN
jgi:hypothetical protein